MKRALPKTEAGIQAWAAAIRRERVSETGRRSVDLAEVALRDAFKAPLAERSRLYLVVDKLLRASFQADKQHNDNTLDRLREHRDAGEALARELKDLQH